MKINSRAGQAVPNAMLVDIPKLLTSYYSDLPDVSIAAERVAFGTSGHRGSSFTGSFNEWHILAVSQAICDYRQSQKIDGPLHIGIDTHALSRPAYVSCIEVLAANDVVLRLAEKDEYTPTPALSLAILVYNQNREHGLADGIVITPSHNPPEDGGIKYNPPNGGPAGPMVTGWIENRANEILKNHLKDVRRIPLAQALKRSSTQRFDFMGRYIEDLNNVVDMDLLRDSKIHIGVDPMGGAGVHYWSAIRERYGLNLTVVNSDVDPTFRFMPFDWDGRIRMDPSSAYAMTGLVALKDRFDISFACDTDHDRHGIVTRSSGLMPPNHYLSVAVHYLFQNRPGWSPTAAVGKTVVSSQMIDRVSKDLGRTLYEVPVGFKWFVNGLLDGSLGFGGEESAGASFERKDGHVWTTDKDGLVPGLLSAEITARTGQDPGEIYKELTEKLGEPCADRLEAPATAAQKQKLAKLSPEQIKSTELAGERIESITNQAPGNGAAIGGIKVTSRNGWFAARPSGTEDIYKIYAESFLGQAHLERILKEAQVVVDAALGT